MAKAKRRLKRPEGLTPNRARTKKPIRFRNRGDSPLTPFSQGKRELLLKLAQELQQMMI